MIQKLGNGLKLHGPYIFLILFFITPYFITGTYPASSSIESYNSLPFDAQDEGYFENGDYIPSNQLNTYLGPDENRNFSFPNQNELSIIQREGLYISYGFDSEVKMKRIQVETNSQTYSTIELNLCPIDENFYDFYNYNPDGGSGDYKFYYDSYITLDAQVIGWDEEIILRFPIEDLIQENATIYPVMKVYPEYDQMSNDVYDLDYSTSDDFIELRIDGDMFYAGEIRLGFLYKDDVVSPTPEEPNSIPPIVYVLMITGIVVVVIFLLSSMTTDQFRSYFTRTSSPRFTFHRLNIDEIFENENRVKILDTILDQPGIHLSELMRITGMQSGQVKWHLDLLEEYGVIQIEKMGQYRVFYPAFSENPLQNIDITIVKSRTTLDVLNSIRRNPGITGSEIGRLLNLKRNTVKYHIDKLVDKGFLRKEKVGNRIKLYLVHDSVGLA